MSKIGYARVSSKSQNLDRQIEKLENAGCEKIFTDVISGVENKIGLNKLMEYIREGDTVVVSELDRLGRSNDDITETLAGIQNKKATIEIMNLPSFQGIEDMNLKNLMMNIVIEVYKYQAESERKNIRERQQQGIEIAKQQGKYKGRKKIFTEDDPRLLHAIELYKEGKSVKDIAAVTGIKVSTLYRYLKEYQI